MTSHPLVGILHLLDSTTIQRLLQKLPSPPIAPDIVGFCEANSKRSPFQRSLLSSMAWGQIERVQEEISNGSQTIIKRLIGLTPPDLLAQILRSEDTATITDFLAWVGPAVSAEVLPYIFSDDILESLALRKTPSAIDSKTYAQSPFIDLSAFDACYFQSLLPNIFLRLPHYLASQYIEMFALKNPALSEILSDQIYDLNAITHLTSEDARCIWSKLNRSTLLIALAAAPQSVQDTFLSSTTRAHRRFVKDEFEFLKRIAVGKVAEARNGLLRLVCKLADDLMISSSPVYQVSMGNLHE